eukprot:9178417-Prorocentrum_lima.AAC.1
MSLLFFGSITNLANASVVGRYLDGPLRAGSEDRVEDCEATRHLGGGTPCTTGLCLWLADV